MNKKQFCPIFVLQKAVVLGICFSKLKKMTLFHVLGLTVSRLQSHYEGQYTFYLFLLFTQENLILILIDLGRMKGCESTLEPPSNFEPGTPGVGIEDLSH